MKSGRRILIEAVLAAACGAGVGATIDGAYESHRAQRISELNKQYGKIEYRRDYDRLSRIIMIGAVAAGGAYILRDSKSSEKKREG